MIYLINQYQHQKLHSGSEKITKLPHQTNWDIFQSKISKLDLNGKAREKPAEKFVLSLFFGCILKLTFEYIFFYDSLRIMVKLNYLAICS